MHLAFPSPGRYGPLVDLLVIILKFYKREAFLMSTRTVSEIVPYGFVIEKMINFVAVFLVIITVTRVRCVLGIKKTMVTLTE